MIDHARLTTPAEHLAVLVEPGVDSLDAAGQCDWASALDDVPLLDSSIGVQRRALRTALQLSGPVVVAGHQPEFFHAGVLAKLLAADLLAERLGGQALMLWTDADLPKQTLLHVPHLSTTGLERVPLPLPDLDPRLPVEVQPRLDHGAWQETFATAERFYPESRTSALAQFAARWTAAVAAGGGFAQAHAESWAAVLEAAGARPPRAMFYSSLAQTGAFRAWAAHLLLAAERVHAAYNAAQAAYRARYHVHNPQRPVPPLRRDADRVETPLWIWHGSGRRQHLFVRDAGGELEVFADDERVDTLSKGQLQCAACQTQPWRLESAGWSVRPRALALSAFARYFVADVFIHGIGGAQYDEVTDALCQEVFGTPPPPLACVSATVRLPLPAAEVSEADVRAAQRAVRDLPHNPQRYATEVDDAWQTRLDGLIAESQRLRREQSGDHAARRAIFEAIRAHKADLAGRLTDAHERMRQRVTQVAARLAQRRLADDREYFAALAPTQTLRDLRRRLRQRVESD